jgi:hypothetical protein
MAAAEKVRDTPAPPLPRWGGWSRESVLFRLGVAVIALHVVDDNYVAPEAASGASDCRSAAR